MNAKKNNRKIYKVFFFFSIWVFFHEHSRFTGQQGKGEGIYLTPLYHFHPLHRHLDISRAITDHQATRPQSFKVVSSKSDMKPFI